jgi:hypothetical protein
MRVAPCLLSDTTTRDMWNRKYMIMTPVMRSSAHRSLLPLVLHAPAIPLVRIFTCGGLRIEVMQEPAPSLQQARYSPPTPTSLSARGALPALILLKHLLSAPHHLRSNDWLSECWYGNNTERVVRRVDNTVSLLRNIFSPLSSTGKSGRRCIACWYERCKQAPAAAAATNWEPILSCGSMSMPSTGM